MVMDTAVLKLTQLGFSEYEARAYTALLKENPLTAYEIAKSSGIPTSKIYEVIKKLENRQTVQSIHGERSKMFIPVSPDELIQNYKSVMEARLSAVRSELGDIKGGMDTSYTWHIRDYDNFIIRAKRMVETALETVLLLTWPSEMDTLLPSLHGAEDRGVKIAAIHYGPANIKAGQTYIHPAEGTIYSEKGARGFVLVADSFPPAVLSSQGMVAWVPTIEFSVNIRNLPTTQWLKCIFRTRFITCGLLEEDGEIWDEAGRLIAISRQIAQYRTHTK